MCFRIGAAMTLALLHSSAAFAQGGQNIVYGGIGLASHEENAVNAMPWSVGVMHQSATSRLVFGVDAAGEGTMLDSTYGGDSLRQALSVNLIVGSNIATTDSMRIDAWLS